MYDMCFSILVHEAPDFFEFQLAQIRAHNPGKRIFIIVHFNDLVWRQHGPTLQQICAKYDNIHINEEHHVTQGHWSSSVIFDAIFSNIHYLIEKDIPFRYFQYLSSNEIFIKPNLIDFLDTLSFDMLEHNYKHQNIHCGRDLAMMPHDAGLQRFRQESGVEPFVGFDFGRVLTQESLVWLHSALQRYYTFPIRPPLHNYSISEVCMSSILSTKPGLRVLDTIQLCRFYTPSITLDESMDMSKYPNTFLYKHVPRVLSHPFVQAMWFGKK
jgi:hypothetical protein